MKLAVWFLLFTAVLTAQSSLESRRLEIERMVSAHPESAFEKVEWLAREFLNPNPSTQAKIQSTQALVHVYLANLELAEQKNNASWQWHAKAGTGTELARNYFNMALIAERKSDYPGAIDCFLKTISLAEKHGQFSLLQKSYRGLAMSYCDQHDYDQALEYINTSLAYQNQQPDIMQKAYSLAAKGEIYRLKNNLAAATDYFKMAYDSFAKDGNDHGRAWVLTNWAICYENNLVKYARIALQAQEIWDRVAPENTMSIVNHGNIGYNYMIMARDSAMVTQGYPDLPQGKNALLRASAHYYTRALELARKKKNLNAIIYQSHNLAGLQYLKGEYQSAYDNLALTMRLKDSVFSQQNKNKIAALESEKEILLRDEKIRLNQITLKNNRKQQWFMLGGLGLLGLIGILLLRDNHSRKKHNLQLIALNTHLDQANKLKARFFAILNHDLRRPVYHLIHFLQLQKESPELLDAESAKRIQSQTLTSAENLLESMEDLLLWSKGQMAHFSPVLQNVNVSSVFADLIKHFEYESGAILEFDNPQNIFLRTDPDYLKAILRNLIGNSLKAVDSKADGKIKVSAFLTGGVAQISIADNGGGIHPEHYKALYDENLVIGIHSGLGFHLIRDLAAAIRCEVLVDTKAGQGSTFTLRLNA